MALDLMDKSLLIGNNHIRLDYVNSTNKYAVEMVAKSNPIEGTVISASYQYEGRGQIGRYWESAPGSNITCSTILRPSFLDAGDQFHLNVAVSLAVHDFVDHFLQHPNIKIKWPNDIYVDDMKIAGILVQNSLMGKTISSSIVGTGININQIIFSSDIPNATSFSLVNEGRYSLEELMPWLFRFITKRYLQLKNNLIQEMKEEYLTSLYRREEWALYNDENKVQFEGKIIGVDALGRLQIKDRNQDVRTFAFREISYVI